MAAAAPRSQSTAKEFSEKKQNMNSKLGRVHLIFYKVICKFLCPCDVLYLWLTLLFCLGWTHKRLKNVRFEIHAKGEFSASVY